MARNTLTPDTVAIGDGATLIIGSDRYAFTIIGRTESGKTIIIRRDKAVPNGPVHDREQYDYTYESDPKGKTYTARWSSKRQRFMVAGCMAVTAGRHQFYDPTF